MIPLPFTLLFFKLIIDLNMPITRIGAAKVLQSARKNKKNDDFFVGDQKGDKIRKVVQSQPASARLCKIRNNV